MLAHDSTRQIHGSNQLQPLNQTFMIKNDCPLTSMMKRKEIAASFSRATIITNAGNAKCQIKQPSKRCGYPRRNFLKLAFDHFLAVVVIALSFSIHSKWAVFASNDGRAPTVPVPTVSTQRPRPMSTTRMSPRHRSAAAAATFSDATTRFSDTHSRLLVINHSLSTNMTTPTHKPTLAPRKITTKPVRPTREPFGRPTFRPSPPVTPPSFRPTTFKFSSTFASSNRTTALPTRHHVTTRPSLVKPHTAKPTSRRRPTTRIPTKPTTPTVRPFIRRPTHFPLPSDQPSDSPSSFPSFTPIQLPSQNPSDTPSLSPTHFPSDFPSSMPSNVPSSSPTVTLMTVPQDELVMDFEGLPMLQMNDSNNSIFVWENITSQHVLSYWEALPIAHVVVTNVMTQFISQVLLTESSPSTLNQVFNEEANATTTRVTYDQTITFGILTRQEIQNVNTDALFTRPFTSSSQDYVNALMRAFNTTEDVVLTNMFVMLPTTSPSPAPSAATPHTRKFNNGLIAIIVVGSVLLFVVSLVGIWLAWQKGHRHVSPPPPPPPPPTPVATSHAMYPEEIPSRLYSNVESSDFTYSGSVKDIYLERSSGDLVDGVDEHSNHVPMGITASASTTSSGIFREPLGTSATAGGGQIGSSSFSTDGGMISRPSRENLQGMVEGDGAAAANLILDSSTEGDAPVRRRPRLASADFMDRSPRRAGDSPDYRRVHSSGDLDNEPDYFRPSDFGGVGGDTLLDQAHHGRSNSLFSPLTTNFPLLDDIEEVDYDVTSPSATEMTTELSGDEHQLGEVELLDCPDEAILSEDEEPPSEGSHIFSMTGFNLQILDLDDM